MLTVIINFAVILVLFGLAMTRIRFRFSYEKDNVGAFVKVWFIRLRLLPRKKKRPPSAKHFSIKPFRRRVERRLKKARKKELERLEKQRTEKKAESDKKAKRDLGALISMLTDMLKAFFARFPRYLRTETARLVVGVASDDAVKTAMTYSAVVQTSQYLITLLETNTRFCLAKNGYVSIYPDFTTDKWTAEVDIKFSIRIWQVVALALPLLGIYLRRGKYRSKKASDVGERADGDRQSANTENATASAP